MFNSIIEFVREVFKEKSVFNSLEAYIIAGNPQGPDDVDRLEREFWEKTKINVFDRYI